MYRRILAPTDGSPVAEAAVDAAIGFARARGGAIAALGVAVPEPSLESLDGAMAYHPGLQVDLLLDPARRQHCELIIMGSHGRRGLSRLMAGSMTQAGLTQAPAPVMVPRPAAHHHGPPARPSSRPAGVP